jgi:hypothetical protein
MSHGHLSKLEAGDVGRPVTPAVLAAYAKATGVDLTQDSIGDAPGGWRVGQLPPAARRKWRGTVAAASVGGALHEKPAKIVESWGVLPRWSLDGTDLAQLAQFAGLLWELGGPLPGALARQLLRWLVELTSDPSPDLQVVISRLAHRAARAGVELDAHSAARWLYLVALHAAVAAEEPDLRGAVLADLAEQCYALDHWHDAQAIALLGVADEHICDDVRKRLHEIKTHAADAAEQAKAAALKRPSAEAG